MNYQHKIGIDPRSDKSASDRPSSKARSTSRTNGLRNSCHNQGKTRMSILTALLNYANRSLHYEKCVFSVFRACHAAQ